MLIDPTLDEVLAFCAQDPIERVIIEDLARRGYARIRGVADAQGLTGLCHFGANVVPSGSGCAELAVDDALRGALMILGDEAAVDELWDAARASMPEPREDRPRQPVFAIEEPPAGPDTGLRPARLDDLELLLPACAASHLGELGTDPLERDPLGFRRRTAAQIQEGRSWVWLEDGTILFKAEAAAWTPRAIQLQQVWVDPEARERGYGTRGLAALCRLLLLRTPSVCLFVRQDNEPAIRLYERIGMRRAGTYRSILF